MSRLGFRLLHLRSRARLMAAHYAVAAVGLRPPDGMEAHIWVDATGVLRWNTVDAETAREMREEIARVAEAEAVDA